MSTTLTKRSCIQYVDCCVYYRFLKSSFIATVEVKCRFCNQPEDVKKHGKCNMHQRYRFQQCRKTFQLDYLYRACNPGIKELIVNLAMNNAGIRDTARALGVSINAVVRVLKKLSPRSVTTLQLNKPKVFLICEVDEMWSFVREKKVQRWLWYAWEPRLKRIIAHAFGDRTTETLNILLQRMENFNVAFCCTDKFSAYNILPHEKHIVGKIYTQRIERENLTLRNRLKRLNRKTLGYSKSAEMHDKVIGTFIERQYYL